MFFGKFLQHRILLLQLAPTHASILEEHRKRDKVAKEKASKNAKPSATIGKHEQDEKSNVSLRE